MCDYHYDMEDPCQRDGPLMMVGPPNEDMETMVYQVCSDHESWAREQLEDSGYRYIQTFEEHHDNVFVVVTMNSGIFDIEVLNMPPLWKPKENQVFLVACINGGDAERLWW